jgi:nucleoside-diphosphate-sugar epimerase
VLDALAELVERLPLVPAQAQWIESARAPVLMDTAKARSELGWSPAHDAHETLVEMVQEARARGLIGPD